MLNITALVGVVVPVVVVVTAPCPVVAVLVPLVDDAIAVATAVAISIAVRGAVVLVGLAENGLSENTSQLRYVGGTCGSKCMWFKPM